MRLIKRLVGWIGFGNHEVNKDSEEDLETDYPKSLQEEEDGRIHHHYVNGALPRKGFSVPVQVPVDRAHQIAPILVPCPTADAAVQGLQWYTKSLKIDEDGDVADEFLEEVFLETSTDDDSCSKFQVNLSIKPAKARQPRLTQQGNVQHHVKHKGRLLLL